MSRSVAKIEQRLASKIEEGEYYEAHQMIRTIASRYKYGVVNLKKLLITIKKLYTIQRVTAIGNTRAFPQKY
jgi:hypothetical protein